MPKTPPKVHQPHDSLFKRIFSQKEVAIDLLKGRLCPDLLQQIDLTKLTLTNSSFVAPELRNGYTDLVFLPRWHKG